MLYLHRQRESNLRRTNRSDTDILSLNYTCILHAHKDSNPDQEIWSHLCYRYTMDVCFIYQYVKEPLLVYDGNWTRMS